ncbi:hypothetical protein FOZ60_004753 [Perkinsus olseni]|uniref:Transmembrane protein n=2 Tax=Perkinsus olseni TaxID=32597 RepID=A0A7J6NSG0_PEROL|nr:hypothetical protein FOZ60_004753 [Perkinsus olseni]
MLQELDIQRATSVSSQVKRLAPPLPRIPESIFENLEVESSRSRNISACGWSCCGGILLILISFWTLGWNEATNSPKENSLVYAFHHARNASCDYVDENNNDHLIWLSCPVIASPILAEDTPLEIRATLSEAGLELRGTQLEWWVEMLQWTEVKVCRGSRKSKCIYRYEKAFRHYDVDPSTFHCATKIRSGCSEVAPAEQPQLKLAELGRPEVLHGVVRAAPDSVIIGNPRNGYLLSQDLISQIDTKAEAQLINADGAAALLGTPRDLYTDLTFNESSARTYVATPRLGDLRLRVSASRSDFVSVIGKQEAGGRLGPYVIPTIRRSEPIEWLLSGDHADLQSLLHYHSREDSAAFWRLLGIFLMWLGTALLLSPLGEAEPSCMAVLCVACFAGAVLSSLLATISATLFASLPVELFMAAIGVAAAVFAWRSYRSSRGSYYEYYYGSDVSVEMPLVAGGPYDDDDHVHWFERRLDNRCIDSSDDEDDDVGKGGLSSKGRHQGRQSRPLPLHLRE